jgi:hypothetical protein
MIICGEMKGSEEAELCERMIVFGEFGSNGHTYFTVLHHYASRRTEDMPDRISNCECSAYK